MVFTGDASGRLLREHTAWFPAGKNAVDFDFGDRTSAGVLYCELTTQYGVLAKKMVAAERKIHANQSLDAKAYWFSIDWVIERLSKFRKRLGN